MEVVHTISDVRDQIRKARKAGKLIGFVPTMGFLHEGHLSLVEISKKKSDFQVMSIFVNKMQFNDPNDFESYPKDLERDIKLAEENGVDLIFIPDDREMYQERLTYIDVESITQNLCGGKRPGHFRGVFTVVSKLFNIVDPDVSVFGQKDIQQAASIEKMVFDLNFPIEIVIAPIIREKDGLAMSSRNKHLTEDERLRALVLSKSLERAEALLKEGNRGSKQIIDEVIEVIKDGNPDKIDYVSLVKYSDLSSALSVDQKSVLAVAVFFGSTRLIDNMIIDFDNKEINCIY